MYLFSLIKYGCIYRDFTKGAPGKYMYMYLPLCQNNLNVCKKLYTKHRGPKYMYMQVSKKRVTV